ncbi:unnamed protein product [Amoebophrya sp. A25]|nr:unnamed protein product [Amoebophrya sp. A25]|eukprot:GSA25T00013135001.1
MAEELSPEATLYTLALDDKTYVLRHTGALIQNFFARPIQPKRRAPELTTGDVWEHLTGNSQYRADGIPAAFNDALKRICVSLDASKNIGDRVAPTREVWATSIQESRGAGLVSQLEIVDVQDYFPLGDMVSFIDSRELRASIEEGEVASGFFNLFDGFTRDLVRAVSGLHTLGYAHRDIKPENILVEQKRDEATGAATGYRLRLADFGHALPTSRKAEGKEGGSNWLEVGESVRNQGSPRYQDPKLLLAKRHDTGLQNLNVFQSDAWAVGISLYTVAGAVFRRFLRDYRDGGLDAVGWVFETPHPPLPDSTIVRADSNAVRWCTNLSGGSTKVAAGWEALRGRERVDPIEGAPVIPCTDNNQASSPSIDFFRKFLTAIVTHAMTCDQNKRDLDALVKEVDGIVVPHPLMVPLPKFVSPPQPPRGPSGSDVPPPSTAPPVLEIHLGPADGPGKEAEDLLGGRLPLSPPIPHVPISPVGAPPPLLVLMDSGQPDAPGRSIDSFLEVAESMQFLAGRGDEGNNYDADTFADGMAGDEYAETGQGRLSPSSFAKESADGLGATRAASLSSSTPHDVAPAAERLAEAGSSAFFAVSDWDWAPAENRDN